jgi:hypothetical protein
MGPWTLETDNNARIISMAYPNAPTGLGVVQLLVLDIDANAKATQGHLTFNSGARREMSKEEVAYFYALLEGPKTVWDHLDAKNQVTKYAPSTTPLPERLAGQFVRVIIRSGKNFFGTLNLASASPGGFFLVIDHASGGPIRFENGIVREVQVAK